MQRLIAVLAAAALLASACGGAGSTTTSPGSNERPASPTAEPSASTRFARGSAVLHGESDIAIDLEVARTDQERGHGLMHRASLERDSGMLFVFPTETTSGFYMKNTLIPLSIAFFTGDGEIVKVLDMVPCAEEPCKIYYPGVTYTRALEVNRGAFDEWGVSEGDTIELHL